MNIDSVYKAEFESFAPGPLNVTQRRLVKKMLETDEFHSIQESNMIIIFIDLLQYRYYEEE